MVNIKDFLLYIIATLLLRALETKDTNSPSRRCLQFRLRVVLHFSSGIVERAKRERAWKSPHAWGYFHARSLYYRWGKMGGLLVVYLQFSLSSTVASVERGKGWLGKLGEELGREEKGLLPFRFALFVPSPSPFAIVIQDKSWLCRGELGWA